MILKVDLQPAAAVSLTAFLSTTVGDERGSTAHLRLASLRPHRGRVGSRAQEIAVLMCEATHETSPSYLSHLVRVADLPGRRYLRLLVLSVSAAGPSQSPKQCDLCSVSADLPLVSKNISVPGLDSLKFTSITRYLLLGPL